LFAFSGRQNFLKSSKEGFAVVIPIVESQMENIIFCTNSTIPIWQFASQQNNENINKARDIFISFNSTKPV
jgi:hypothetical protein